MRFLLLALFFIPRLSWTIESENSKENNSDKESLYAFIPYLSYESTQSWSIGAAIEKESENKNIDNYFIDAETTLKNSKLRLDVKYGTHLNSNWSSTLRANFTNFFDPFYGFGMSTKVEDLKKINQRVYGATLSFSYEQSPILSYGPYIKFLQRNEQPVPQILNQHIFADETSFSLGVSALFDTLDSKHNPHSGNKHELFVSIVPNRLNSVNHANTFSKIKLDLRKYFPIYETVFATRFTAGTIIGEPNYLYKYRLGGIDLLRGYESNRFIGNNLLSIQLEERVYLYKKYIAVTGSYEAGSINSNPTQKIRTSKGMGLRVAMPPDWNNYLTINVGFGDDQKNSSLEFNENF